MSEKLSQQSMKTLAAVLLIGLPAAIIVAGIGGYWLAGRALAPVDAIATKAREITAEKLSDRLPVANPNDEFGRLALVFNDVLTRVQESFERLRRFTSDASHELRTPLTAIRSVGEVALQDHLPPDHYRDVIGSMLEETDRLTRLLDSLLTLTRADNDRATVRKETIDASELVREVADFLHAVAEDRGQRLMVEAGTTLEVSADRSLLRQALINLVDNAIKYSPSGGAIRISTRRSDEQAAVIEVADSGLGIAPEHQGLVFDRFYRVDQARSRETGGVGLGLAIARWAVEINGGRIELQSEEGKGCTFRIVLPNAASVQAKTV